MPNISSIVKNVRNIMRNEDQGISGDAQRLEQLGWMLFLKILDEKDQELELIREGYTSVIPEKFQWRIYVISFDAKSKQVVLLTLYPVPSALNRELHRQELKNRIGTDFMLN